MSFQRKGAPEKINTIKIIGSKDNPVKLCKKCGEKILSLSEDGICGKCKAKNIG